METETESRRRRRGFGDKAIANYVRKHRPDIMEEVLLGERVQQRFRLEKMKAGYQAKLASKRQEKITRLIAELADLGVNTSTTDSVGGYILNGAKF